MVVSQANTPTGQGWGGDRAGVGGGTFPERFWPGTRALATEPLRRTTAAAAPRPGLWTHCHCQDRVLRSAEAPGFPGNKWAPGPGGAPPTVAKCTPSTPPRAQARRGLVTGPRATHTRAELTSDRGEKRQNQPRGQRRQERPGGQEQMRRGRRQPRKVKTEIKPQKSTEERRVPKGQGQAPDLTYMHPRPREKGRGEQMFEETTKTFLNL